MSSPTLGEFIRSRRTELGQSLYATARPSGVTPTAIAAIEQGRVHDPRLSTLAGIARGVRVELSQLVSLALAGQQ